MNRYLALMAMGPLVCFATPDEGQGGSPPDLTAPAGLGDEATATQMPNAAIVSDGQIALTARNNGDGTWAVTAGPGGMVLEDGLAREKAIAIVGAPTGPYNPSTVRQGEEADQRVAAEQKLVDDANENVLKSDDDLGLIDPALQNRSVTDPSTGRKPSGAGTAGPKVVATGVPEHTARQANASEADVEERRIVTTQVVGGQASGAGAEKGSKNSPPAKPKNGAE